MPIHPEMSNLHPPEWSQASGGIRFERANNRRVWRKVENYLPRPETGSKVVLTVAHPDYRQGNNAEDKLAALCHRACDGLKSAQNTRHNALRDADKPSRLTTGDST